MLVAVAVVALFATGCASLTRDPNRGRGVEYSEKILRPTGDVPKIGTVIHVIAILNREVESQVIWTEMPTDYAMFPKVRVMTVKGFRAWSEGVGDERDSLCMVQYDSETSIRLILMKD